MKVDEVEKAIETVGRFCESHKRKCGTCTVGATCSAIFGCNTLDEPLCRERILEVFKAADEWDKASRMTRQEAFLKKLPNAQLDKDGILTACPIDVFGESVLNDDVGCTPGNGSMGCVECRKKYWSSKVDDE